MAIIVSGMGQRRNLGRITKEEQEHFGRGAVLTILFIFNCCKVMHRPGGLNNRLSHFWRLEV
jgi:hypothetical protein